MYQSIYFDRSKNTVHLWDDNFGYTNFTRQQDYYKLAKNDTIKGSHKYLFDNYPVVNVDGYNGNPNDYLQIDLSPEIEQLIKYYNDSDSISENIKIVIIDIEVEMESNELKEEEAKNTITSIAMYDHTEDKYYVYVLSDEVPNYNADSNVTVISFKSEVDLLKQYINDFKSISPHIVVGWNSDSFDNRYLYFRINRVLGNKWVKKLSPIEIVKYSEKNKMVDIAGVASLDYMKLYKNYTYSELSSYALDYVANEELGHGKIKYEGSLDTLFKTDINKFIEYNLVDVKLITELDKKVDFINLTRRICHVSHIPYQQFIHSSAVIEGAIMSYMDKNNTLAPNKSKKINMTSNMVHYSGINTLSVDVDCDRERIPTKGLVRVFRTKSTKDIYEYIDYNNGVFYLKNELDKSFGEGCEVKLAFEGAYVRLPEPSIYEYFFSIDLQSLYPSIIITLNISPETKIGRILNWEDVGMMNYINSLHDGEIDFSLFSGNFNYIDDDAILIVENLQKERFNLTKQEFIEFIEENKYTIASNGLMYRTDIKGLIPTILSDWFNKRLEYKSKLKQAIKDNDPDASVYYDKLQLVQKILLNSIYGVLGLESFRFYDLENAGAVTATGRDVIKYASFIFNKLYSINNNERFEDVVIYNDTDSSYVPFHPNDYSHIKDLNNPTNEEIDILSNIAAEYCDNINESLEAFSKIYLNSDNNRLKFNREKITRRGLWLGKKRYAQYVIDSEGKRNLKDPLDFKGIDVVRSSFPVKFRTHLKTLMELILIDYDKEKSNELVSGLLKTIGPDDYEYISKISSIKKMNEYDDDNYRYIHQVKKGTPVAVKSAIYYNRLLSFYNASFKYRKIKQGDKIKYVYLKHNPFNIDVLGYPVEEPYEEIIDFMKQYIDINKIYDSELSNKLKSIYDAIGWTMPSKTIDYSDFY